MKQAALGLILNADREVQNNPEVFTLPEKA